MIKYLRLDRDSGRIGLTITFHFTTAVDCDSVIPDGSHKG